MKLGMTFPQKWLDKCAKDEIQVSDILYGLAIEDLLRRIERSSFYEYLWLTNEQAVGLEAYKKKSKERLSFLYVESGKKNYLSHVVAGQALDQELFALFLEELFSCDGEESQWEYTIVESEKGKSLHLTFSYMDMKVPVSVYIGTSAIKTQKRKKKELPLLFEGRKKCTYLCYSKESILAEDLFEIMRKLELISDMEAYGEANLILKDYSISGRYILEEFSAMAEKEPKVATMKRLEQIASYKNYGYMKKRWQQYERNHNTEKEDWESVLARIYSFTEPVWKALCADEIFFDDWMPELERFLG
ncbi:MAG: hypothetical protein IJA07_02940 [Agathobacter sp.]|nr:hypothetical protein [Agathobacter sp.]